MNPSTDLKWIRDSGRSWAERSTRRLVWKGAFFVCKVQSLFGKPCVLLLEEWVKIVGDAFEVEHGSDFEIRGEKARDLAVVALGDGLFDRLGRGSGTP